MCSPCRTSFSTSPSTTPTTSRACRCSAGARMAPLAHFRVNDSAHKQRSKSPQENGGWSSGHITGDTEATSGVGIDSWKYCLATKDDFHIFFLDNMEFDRGLSINRWHHMYYPYLLVFHGIQRYNRNMSPTVWYLKITIFYRTRGTRHNFHFLLPKSPSSRCRTEKLIDHRFPFGEYVHQPRNQDKSGFPELGVIPKWMVKKGESPIKMDDLGVALF